MDKILEAVVLSSYPASVKQGLVRRVLEAARRPLEREQCLALLALGARLYVDGADELARRAGCQLLHVAGRHHPEAFAEFFSARRVLRLLQGAAGPPGPRALACVQLGLQLLPAGPAAEEVSALLRREVLRAVCERPGPAACAQVARLLARHPHCLPEGPHRLLFCRQLVRCLGRFRCPAEGEEGAVEFLEQAQQVSGLLAQLWRAQPAAVLPCLKELFAVISGSEEEPPSCALASVVQHLPLELMEGVVRNLSNDDSVTDSQMLTAVSRMIDWVSWPLGKNIDKWIIALLKGLAAVKKFSLLIEVSLAKIEKVFSKLLYPIVRGPALSVLKYMLLTFQHSHEAFHLLLPHIPPVVASLLKEDSNSGASCLEQLAELVHCMVFRFPGFPDLYEPVMEAIKDLHVPNEDRIKQLLGQDAWTSQKSELAGFYPRLMAKSDTGKTGLINLGNTCYVNSILQALFMASDFRHCVLRLTENNSQPLMTKLQWLFAFLEHSQRPAISPENFLSASWTPWFSPGAQQDCSEYLKYLLDRLHEEEKTGTRICQKLKQSSLLSPPEEPPGPSATSVERMFGGKIVTRICCLRCLNVSSREEAFTDLSLAFPPPERCHRHRLASAVLPAEGVGVPESPPPPPAQVQGRAGPQRQRKHCITVAVPPNILDMGGLGSQKPGEQSQEEKVEKEEEAEQEKGTEEEEEGRTKEKEEEEEEKEVGEEKKVEKQEKDGASPGPGTHRAAPAREASRSVLDLVNYFLSPERLQEENRYYCEPCASLQEAEKVVELSQGPRYLILTLLRFSFDPRTLRRRKILEDVALPLLLRLPLAGGRARAYDLCSVVVHSGVSSESGHYYCYAREGARPAAPPGAGGPEPEHQWYLFNDTRVSFSSFESVSNVTSFFPKDTAYVLFYRQRPRPGEGPEAEAEPGSPRARTEPALHKDLMEAISRDNILFLQEQEKEARSRAAYISTLPGSPCWGRGFDEDKDEDEGSPGGCSPAGGSGGDFHRLVF
ncbi:ubiquitin carboxyl-terminal hydrolase 35 [Pipistrellus kuhlii]|uniref:Ubiquitin carboxyl-terminal hydrolase n=1 Tax=Pipistrellus kuhlii TaxID=59472 RepID=A0A7J7X343_PIPKU|nr:ubiquitin carboxyl-terminal hydrolase 35 [Pipistrellus kuhlii]XP_045433660.1 ubiquitin carboxyl-terminal hydrolase 35 [Pipistrellus kuhlii]XP_045433661.1 ubiquitin carboxyl-terminal hydrolase 35 [Pipistrellus kuhlii]KAF6343866.1 ubiquitin specific peptidase 35 [Pipistrellus kuhlii]